MKHFKISTTMVITILATSITLISHAKPFKTKIKSPSAVTCFTKITYYTANCTPISLAAATSACSTATAGIGRPANLHTEPVDPLVCDVSGLKFCCAEVQIALTQCGQSLKITAIYCKLQ
jgi:hypothetical protein